MKNSKAAQFREQSRAMGERVLWEFMNPGEPTPGPVTVVMNSEGVHVMHADGTLVATLPLGRGRYRRQITEQSLRNARFFAAMLNAKTKGKASRGPVEA